MDQPAAQKILHWRYAPPYDLYNLDDPQEVNYLVDPQNSFYQMRGEGGELVGFCSFGKDGQVPGGNYSLDALDIGMGMHPDLTGAGRGSTFASAVLEFALDRYRPSAFRVTIAAFNQRAQRVWEQQGFQLCQTFTFPPSNRDFVVMVKTLREAPA
jgi:RimJ/RimL family protein N-acetyltransferase